MFASWARASTWSSKSAGLAAVMAICSGRAVPDASIFRTQRNASSTSCWGLRKKTGLAGLYTGLQFGFLLSNASTSPERAVVRRPRREVRFRSMRAQTNRSIFLYSLLIHESCQASLLLRSRFQKS